MLSASATPVPGAPCISDREGAGCGRSMKLDRVTLALRRHHAGRCPSGSSRTSPWHSAFTESYVRTAVNAVPTSQEHPLLSLHRPREEAQGLVAMQSEI